jgi:hypothetical protein
MTKAKKPLGILFVDWIVEPTEEERAEGLFRAEKLQEWHDSIYGGAPIAEPFEIFFQREKEKALQRRAA